MEADTQTNKLDENSDNDFRATADETVIDPSLWEALTSIQQFVAAWEAENGHPDDHVFYRLTCRSGQYDLSLSALRGVGKAIPGGYQPSTPPRVKQNLSDDERERRRQRMKDYWRKKRGEAAGA